MERFVCEREERGDYDGGGCPPCYFPGGEAVELWCQPCQSRDPLFRKMVQLKAIERGYLRQLCALIDRREKARNAGAVDPVTGVTTE